jgi:hypothetical protein
MCVRTILYVSVKFDVLKAHIASASVADKKFTDKIISFVYTGIVVGVTIGVGCMILSTIAIVWRRRCIKSASPECSGAAAGSACGPGGLHANGNGYYREWDRCPASHSCAMAASSENHEMDYFAAAVTTNIPCDSNADHLDTKVSGNFICMLHVTYLSFNKAVIWNVCVSS